MSSNQTGHSFRDAIICLANYAQFGARDRRVLPAVRSRMCLWCKGGHGRVVINHTPYACASGDYFFLPWDHHIEYVPDDSHPFHLAGIHIIPCHDRRHGIDYDVPHFRNHPLYRCPWRNDAELPGLSGTMHRRLSLESPLTRFSEAIVDIFRSSPHPIESQMRFLAQALIHELARTFGSSPPARAIPRHVADLASYLDRHFADPLTVADMARQAGRSRSAITAAFTTHYGKSPVQYLIARRIANAATLLATTSLPVGEIGARAGIPDPFYFSKLFRKITAHSPRDYRRLHQRF